MTTDIPAVDVMNYPFTTELNQKFWSSVEMQTMLNTVFRGKNPFPDIGTPAQFVGRMDEAGYEKVFVAAVKMGSYRRQWMATDFTVDEVANIIKEYPDRLVGLAGYNPFAIEESLGEIEKGVVEYGFKGVYVHSLGWGLGGANDRRLYPCYAKCVELGVPVSMQSDHSLEMMPSEPGRPIYIDDVGLDFPRLVFIASHPGWPWCEELVALAWKHQNVCIDISAHMPRYLDRRLLEFMDTRGSEKVLFGTNGLGLKLCRRQFLDLDVRDETKRKILRENALRVFKV